MTTEPEPEQIHQLFEAQAAASPDRIAVRFEDEVLTYGELDARASALAGVLRARGVGAEVAVGLCVERSLDLPIGLLGILKAGGVYVPLDPELPAERLRHIVRDTRAALLVTREGLRDQLGDPGTEVVLLDADAADVPHRLRANERPSLAYIMYTSGSTGPPKGVAIEHLALTRRFAISPYQALMGRDDVLAAITAVSWNPSVYEILYPLAQGATIALASREVMRDPVRLARFLGDYGVTFMRAVPSLWRALIDAGWQGKPDLRIVCHGERLDAALARRLAACGAGVWDTWGSTEASVFRQVELDERGARLIRDGMASSGVEVLVLGPDLGIAPAGVPGEIHIGGPVLARGYVGDPALTAARFVASPRGRLYKTGDLGRYRPDGSIELLGRADDQVKIRGQRVELGEVEAAVARYPGVRAVVATVREDAPGDQRLIAYLVPDADIALGELRAFLKRTLPEFMLPAAFVPLDALPLNANGKVDRRALPAPDGARPALLRRLARPETPAQEALAGLFAEVLGYAEVGIDDDFFDLGGHSLLAARVASRVKTTFELDLSLVAFFEAPTVRALAATIERRRAQGERSAVSAIARASRREEAPLSFAQERLWFLSQLTPGDSAYNLPSALRLDGALDVGALEAALRHILARHEALRTSIAADAGGRPLQTVHALDALPRFALPLVDLAHLAPEARLEAARERIAEAALLPFDLGRAPLLRAALYRLSPLEHALFVNMHHAASDGWSKAVFRRELGGAYNAFVAGRTPSLPALPFQYVDYAAWQRGYLGHGELERQLAYWRSRLAGLETLALPTDRARPKVFSHRGAREELRLPKELAAALRDLANRQGASVFMVLLAAFDALLFRYSGQTGFAVGSPIAGRNVPETEGLIGFFVNTLVLRAEVSRQMRFSELLQQVRHTALEAYAHQDLPFERLVSELNPERDMARHPLIQTVFALQNTPWEEVALAGVESRPFELRSERSRLDLELHVWERPAGLVCHLIYNTDLFDAWRMEQMLRHFARLLEQVVRSPDERLGDLGLLSPSERERILVGWNATERPFPRACLHELFEAQAARTPERLVVVQGQERLAYRELNERANQLARHLRARGVVPERRVALCLDRSPALLVAMLGVWKAGGAYVPMDPAYPVDRLAYMLEDSGASLLITRRELAARLADDARATILVDDLGEVAQEARDDPRYPADPEQLAYVIYTSGSTGRPSGVEVPHRGLVNVTTWHVLAHEVTPEDRATLVASPSFDASVLETWPYLVAGASLHIPDDEARKSPARLGAWLTDHAISIAFVPTPLLEACLDGGHLATSRLRAIVTGGDRLTRAPPSDASFVLYNHYGPTEASVASTCARVPSDRAGAPPSPPPPIGRPIANVQAYVLDPGLSPVPVGVPGELHIGGAGLARGYAARPELTLRRFIDNPFGPGRLYKTGDLVRYRPDGDLEFLGRLDHQIKIRGYRIEPGEIDAALVEHPGIREALTIAREDRPGERRLVSYLAADRSRRDEALEREVLARWQALYEEEYRGTMTRGAEPDFTGWNSSFTGEPIPLAQMREWVDCTVREILGAHPERILEIGCGTGLLLFPLAKEARHYVATDFSRKAIATLQRRISGDAAYHGRVELAVSAAHDLDRPGTIPGRAGATFDTVILNSVVQYFPSSGYLFEVLEKAVARVSPGGRVFIGDVRNLDLGETFHLALELARAPGEIACAALKQRVETGLLEDKELLVAPSFFHGLVERLPRVSAVAVRPKRGVARNEMTMFRYDVTLHIESPVRRIAAREIDWDEASHDLAALERELLEDPRAAVLVTGLVDARLAFELGAQNALAAARGNERIALPDAVAGAVDLESLHALAARTGHRVDVRLGPGSRVVDALFSDAPPGVPLSADGFHRATTLPAGSELASDPLRMSRAGRLLPEIREHLCRRLPDFMIPSSFVFLDTLPRTPNGKLDRRRLPAPKGERSELQGAYVAPGTPTQGVLARIFAEALALDAVGVRDNFFELGGHSLLAVQVVTRIHDLLGAELPLAALFEGPTVEALSHRVERAAAEPGPMLDEHVAEDVTTLPLTPTDVSFQYGRVFFEVGEHAFYQVLEIELPALDLARLEAAILYAVNRHPIARGRLSSSRSLGRRAYWDVAARLAEAPLVVREARDERTLEAIKAAIVDSPFPVDEAPACRFVLARGADRDLLLLRYNHNAIDGSGLVCLLNSLFSHYLGLADPALRVVPFRTSELLAYYGRGRDGAPAGPSARGRALARLLGNTEIAHLSGLLPGRLVPGRRWLETSLFRPREIFPAQLHPLGGDARSRRCDAVELGFSADEGRRLTEAVRTSRTTLDRLFLVGLLCGAEAWNRSFPQGGRRGSRRIEAYWAVNLRPPKYFESIVANQFAWSRVRSAPAESFSAWLGEMLDPAADFLLRGALDWIDLVEGFHQLQVPNAVRWLVMKTIQKSAPAMLVSNTLPFGELDRSDLAKAIGVRRVRPHSRFAFSDRPAIVISRRDERFHLKMAYPRSLFDPQGAARFLERCKATTLEMAERVTSG